MNLSPDQRAVILKVARVLDFMAGNGEGQNMDDGETIWADDLVGELAAAFGLEWTENFVSEIEEKLYD